MRDFAVRKQNTDTVATVDAADGILLSEFNDEEAGPQVLATIITRAVKLGTTEYKRLETIIARLQAEQAVTVAMKIEGSDNCEAWSELRNENFSTPGNTLIRRTPASFKYVRFSLSVSTTDYFSLTSIDMEYYLKIFHHMR